MPLYCVFINKQDTGEYVRGSSWEDAYSDVSAINPLKYEDIIELKEVHEVFPQKNNGEINYTT